MPLWIGVAVLVLTYLRFGYAFGSGDHDELIPSIFRLLDASLYPRDWIVETVTSGITVRTYFLWLVAAPSVILPVWVTALLLWIIVGISVSYGVFSVGMELLGDRLAAALGTLLALVVTVRFTIGHSAVLYHMLVPEGVAWAFSIPAIAMFLRGKMLLSGVLFGVATWFHLLAGLHPVMLIAPVALLGALRGHGEVGDVLRFTGVFVVAALPALIPVAWDQIVAATAAPDGASPLYVHAYFRNPFHHLLSGVPLSQAVRFGIVFMTGIVSGAWLVRRGVLRHGRLLAEATLLAVVLIMGGALLLEGAGIALAAKFQFQKLSLLLTMGFSLLVAGATVSFLGNRLRKFGDRLLDARRTLLGITLGLGATIVALSITNVLLTDRAEPIRHQETALAEVERWAREHTPVTALFAIPPSVSTFRSHARRSIVANYAAFVFTDEDMQTWFERLRDVAPIDPPPDGFEAKSLLDTAYHANDAAYWLQLDAQYEIDFVLVQAEEAMLPFQIALEVPGWRVYRLTAEDR